MAHDCTWPQIDVRLDTDIRLDLQFRCAISRADYLARRDYLDRQEKVKRKVEWQRRGLQLTRPCAIQRQQALCSIGCLGIIKDTVRLDDRRSQWG